MRYWEGIVIHHSASPSATWQGTFFNKINADNIRQWHIEKGYGDIGYHFVIDRDGLVQAGRNLELTGAHCRAGQRNHKSIGICLSGNFQHESPTPYQMQALLILVKQLQQKYAITKNMVELHGNVVGASTLCPGRFFPVSYFYSHIN